MSLRLLQVALTGGKRSVVALGDDGRAVRLDGIASTYELAGAALAEGSSLEEAVRKRTTAEAVDVSNTRSAVRLLPPIDHPDPAHLLSHGHGAHASRLGGEPRPDACARRRGRRARPTRCGCFSMGVKGGKPAGGSVGVAAGMVLQGRRLERGRHRGGARDARLRAGWRRGAGDRRHLPDRPATARRAGSASALANEFSDHVTERENYLWLAHSKLRPRRSGRSCCPGRCPRTCAAPAGSSATAQVIWEKPFLTGEANMSHTIANLEHHHFKYGSFRRPGDVHVHFFGTATLSFSEQSLPSPATCSRSARTPSCCRCATGSPARPPTPSPSARCSPEP